MEHNFYQNEIFILKVINFIHDETTSNGFFKEQKNKYENFKVKIKNKNDLLVTLTEMDFQCTTFADSL